MSGSFVEGGRASVELYLDVPSPRGIRRLWKTRAMTSTRGGSRFSPPLLWKEVRIENFRFQLIADSQDNHDSRVIGAAG